MYTIETFPADASSVVIAVDVMVPHAIAEAFLGQRDPGEVPSNLVIIYSNEELIEHFLTEDSYKPHLKSQRLRLWSSDSWQEAMQSTCEQDIRSSLIACRTLIKNPQDEELGNQVEQFLLKIHAWHRQVVEVSRSNARDYYSSEGFQRRLKRIARGAMPKVLIEQACHTVATKQFARGLFEGFRVVGIEAHLHTPCPESSYDYLSADMIDIGHFQPDLLIRFANGYGAEELQRQTYDIPQLPIVIPLQDVEPHLNFAPFVQSHPLHPLDIVLSMHDRVIPDIKKAGVPEEQILCDYIPIDPLPFDPDQVKVPKRYDVGLVKTLNRSDSLLERIGADLEGDELAAALSAEEILRHSIEQEKPLDLFECGALGCGYPWTEHTYTAYHEWLCIDTVRSLIHTELGLAGANWDRLPELAPHAIGHLHSRDRYLKNFMQTRINLSINPWNEYHMRVLDGGQCGAFFLVHRVPDDVRWRALPKELVAGEHYDTYFGRTELKEKVNYYLYHPNHAEEIGKNLQKAVRGRYSYENLADKILTRFRLLCNKQNSISGLRPASS